MWLESNFKQLICNNYGENSWTLIRKLEDNLLKLKIIDKDRKYLKWCLNHKVTPKGLGLHKEIKENLPKTSLWKIEYEIIKNAMKFKGIKQKRLGSKYRKLKKKICRTFIEFGDIFEWTKEQVRSKMAIRYRRINDKVNRLAKKQINELESKEKENWVNKQIINLSDVNLSNGTKQFLSKGLKYNLISKPKRKEIVYSLESIVLRSNLELDQQTELREKWSEATLNYFNKIDQRLGKNKNKLGLNGFINKCKDELKDVVICQADKSKATVIINKQWENEKITEELNKVAYISLDDDRWKPFKKI